MSLDDSESFSELLRILRQNSENTFSIKKSLCIVLSNFYWLLKWLSIKRTGCEIKKCKLTYWPYHLTNVTLDKFLKDELPFHDYKMTLTTPPTKGSLKIK